MNSYHLTKSIQFSLILFVILFLTSCGGGSKSGSSVKSERAGINEVVIQESSDPDKLNPITYNSANANYIIGNIFQALLNLDPTTLEFVPVLAVARPTITEITEGPYNGGLKIEYEIRPEAKWDNGSPITAEDVAFTLKAIKNPKVNGENLRPYYEFIDDLVIDPSNNKKFTMFSKQKYILAESVSAITVLPEYVYDAEKIMRNFTVKFLNDPANLESLKGNDDIIRFAESFNGQKFQRDKNGVVGSGAYELDQWVTGQRIILKKKANWWGSALNSKKGFSSGPDKIIYEIISDEPASISALRGEKIDLKDAITSKDFLELEKEEKITSKYNLHKPTQFSYSYIGLNMRNPKLNDKRVRRALAHLTNVDEMIKVLAYGMSKRVTGPFSHLKKYYNADLKPIQYDVTLASSLLDEAGWKDSDNDGIRDKVINGKKTQLSLNIKRRAGDPTAEKILAMMKESAKTAGVEFVDVPKEWTVLIEELDRHDFEMSFIGWSMSPLLDDPKQTWHTSSYNGGSNNVGFGDQKTDELIDQIRSELNEEKRNELYKQFQQIVYDEQPYIFLWSPLKKMAFHKRFDKAEPYTVRPGYDVTEWMIKADWGK